MQAPQRIPCHKETTSHVKGQNWKACMRTSLVCRRRSARRQGNLAKLPHYIRSTHRQASTRPCQLSLFNLFCTTV